MALRNITGVPVVGEDLFGREFELDQFWSILNRGGNILMLAPRRVGKTSLMREVERNPQNHWLVCYLDLEAGDTASYCVAAIAAAITSIPDVSSVLQTNPISSRISDVLSKIDGKVDAGLLTLEFKGAFEDSWHDELDRVFGHCDQAIDAGVRLLVILDELPILIARMLSRDDTAADVDLLLSKLRQIRGEQRFSQRVQFAIGGSIGLEGVLRRHGLSSHINDLSLLPIGPWENETAAEFLHQLGHDEGFIIPDNFVEQMIKLLGYCVPYHVQLFFDSIRQETKSDDRVITEEIVIRCFEDRLAGPSGTPHLDHYAEQLDVMFNEDDAICVRAILSAVARSADGLDPKAICERADIPQPLPQDLIRDLLASGYLVTSNGRISMCSNLLRSWWARFQSGK